MFSEKDLVILNVLVDRKKANNGQIELETRITKNIERDQFIGLAKKLKDLQYRFESIDEYMNINLKRQNINKFYNIRYTINGLDNIRAYCKLEEVDNVKRIYKKNLKWTDSEKDAIIKKNVNEFNTFNLSHYINEYNIKFNCKSELEINNDDDITDKDAKNEIKNLNDDIQKIGWNNIEKVFRYIKRTSFYTIDNNYRIDLSIVKSNKKTYSLTGSEYVMSTKTFKESGTLNSIETYEVEIEYIGNNNIDSKLIIDGFREHNQKLLSYIFYNSQYVISQSQSKNIIDTYSKSIKNMLVETFEKKMDKTNSNHLTLLNSLKRLNYNKNTKSKFFFVPKVVSMSIENLHKEYNINILENYTVTDKTDGITALLYIPDNKSGVYMFDSNMRVFCLDLDFKDTSVSNTIIAGEFVDSSVIGELPRFLAFDIYLCNGIDTRLLPLIDNDITKDTRVKKISEVVNKLKFSNISIECKTFKFGDDIFKLSKEIWDKKDSYGYKLDGLIYTPKDFPVGFDKLDSIEFLTKMSATWLFNIKWKPSEDNTIDFLIKIEKEQIEIDKSKNIYLEREKVSYKTKLDNNNMNFIPYKTLNLYCGINVGKDENTGFSKYMATKFIPTSPYDENAYIANIKCDLTGQNIYCIGDKSKIMDNTIVEFAYNNIDGDFKWIPMRTRLDKTLQYNNDMREKERLFRIFTKYTTDSKYNSDKYNFLANEKEELSELEFLKKGRQIPKREFDAVKYYRQNLSKYIKSPIDIPYHISFGNDYNTANSVWQTIHYPITEEMICYGKNIPKLEDREEVYYSRGTDRSNLDTLVLQDFHNKIVKKMELYTKTVNLFRQNNPSGEIHLLELACGKIGDLYKWQSNKINNVVAVDIFSSNLYDKLDGAYKRYVEFKLKSKLTGSFIPEITLLLGDATKNIKSGEFLLDDDSKKKHQMLWNSGIKYSQRGFDIISMQFALHYMFKNNVDLDKFVENISENLRPNGYFIGTVIDGKQLYKDLVEKEFGDSIERSLDNGKLVWRITKKYTNNKIDKELTLDNYTLGMAVDVYFSSIGNTLTEFLVYLDYFKQKLEKYSIEIVEEQSFRDIYNNYLKKDIDEYKFLENMSKIEKDFSFYNKTFIFKRQDSDHIFSREIYNYIEENIAVYELNKIIKSIVKNNEDDSKWDELFKYIKSFPKFQDLTQNNVWQYFKELLIDKLKSKKLSIPDVVLQKKEKKSKTTKDTTKEKVIDPIVKMLMEQKDFKINAKIVDNFTDIEKENIESIIKDFNSRVKTFSSFLTSVENTLIKLKNKPNSTLKDKSLTDIANSFKTLVKKILKKLPKNYKEYEDLVIAKDMLVKCEVALSEFINSHK